MVEPASLSAEVLWTASVSTILDFVRLTDVLGIGTGSASCSSSEAEESRILSLEEILRVLFGAGFEEGGGILLVGFGGGFDLEGGTLGSSSLGVSSFSGAMSEGMGGGRSESW